MNKQEFEQTIKNNIHEHLYIKKNDKIKHQLDHFGCYKKNNSYTIYYIDNDNKIVFFGITNNEYDAYDYLYEIFEYRHDVEINKLLDEYFYLPNEERKKYKEMINFYNQNDIKFSIEFGKRIEQKKLERRINRGRNS